MVRSSSPLQRSLIVQGVRDSVVTSALTEAIHAQLLWEHLLLDISRKPRLTPEPKIVRQALIRKEESS